MRIDLKNRDSINSFHSLMKEKLKFPEYYGMNWDAFWDSITGLVKMPNATSTHRQTGIPNRCENPSHKLQNIDIIQTTLIFPDLITFYQ